MTYSAKDLERAVYYYGGLYPNISAVPLAELIADVRREALEAAAQIADANDLPGTAEHIRALKDKP